MKLAFYAASTGTAKLWLGVLLALTLTTVSLRAQTPRSSKSAVPSVPTGKPEDLGFSAERLQRVYNTMQRHIDAGEISGVVTLIARNGRVAYYEAQGSANIEAKKPMQKDNVFNLASATKPVVAVSVLMLVEEGKIRIGDPISKYIPEFKNPKVRDLKPDALTLARFGDKNPTASSKIVPAAREVTIRDLLTHTSGIMSVGVENPAAPDPNDLLKSTLAEMMPRFASAPLDFQPGTKWAYSNWAGFDILARIVEIVSGKSYDQFLRERLFEPLGIRDMGFGPQADYRAPRLAVRYGVTPSGLKPLNPPTPWSMASKYFSGAAGLSGTADDYWRFAQMLINHGEFNGKRILSPATVDLMRGNHVGELYAEGPMGHAGEGFGYGVSVITNRNLDDTLLPDGAFGWPGASGCKTTIIPSENMIIVFLVPGGNFGGASADFETTAMQALVK